MKTITLKVEKENINGNNVVFTTYDVLRTVINSPIQGGIGVEEMMSRLKLLQKLESFKSLFDIPTNLQVGDDYLSLTADLKLEDTDFEKLKMLFKECKWNIVSKFICNLSEEINKKQD